MDFLLVVCWHQAWVILIAHFVTFDDDEADHNDHNSASLNAIKRVKTCLLLHTKKWLLSARNLNDTATEVIFMVRMYVCIYRFHNRWNRMVSVRHPSLWVFLARLKSEDVRIVRDMRHHRMGLRIFNRRANWRCMEDRIQHLMTWLPAEETLINIRFVVSCN